MKQMMIVAQKNGNYIPESEAKLIDIPDELLSGTNINHLIKEAYPDNGTPISVLSYLLNV